MPLRKHPPPPTGHDLMTWFPTAPPDNFKKCSTSEYFRRQERDFFAQAGKEIVRVKFNSDVDLTHNRGLGPGPSSSTSTAPPHHSLGHLPSALSSSLPYSHSATRQVPSKSVSVHDFSPLSSHTPTSNQLPSDLHPPFHHTMACLQTPIEDSITPQNPKPEYSEECESDESWMRPMPYADRRRAGKHTRRVIIRT